MGKTNTFSILAIIFAFVFPPLGLIFGIMALSQIKKSKEDGKGLAIAGIVISSLIILAVILFFSTIFMAVKHFIGINLLGNSAIYDGKYFTFEYPIGWEKDPYYEVYYRNNYILFTHLSEAKDSFSMSVYRANVSYSSLEDFSKAYENYLKEGNVTIISKENIKIPGKDAIKYLGQFDWYDNFTYYSYRQNMIQKIIFIDKDVPYELAYAAPKEVYPTYEKAFENLVNTFKTK